MEDDKRVDDEEDVRDASDGDGNKDGAVGNGCCLYGCCDAVMTKGLESVVEE